MRPGPLACAVFQVRALLLLLFLLPGGDAQRHDARQGRRAQHRPQDGLAVVAGLRNLEALEGNLILGDVDELLRAATRCCK